jgi:ureidoglycolate amidohydrolase
MHTLKLISISNIKKDIETLDNFNSTPGNGTTRVLFSKEELQARDYIKNRMKEQGLAVREDAAGNILGKLEGSDPTIPEVWTGSHIDTVINGGKFDGMLGVVGALEAIRVIKESGVPFKRNIQVVVFTSEEPTRFGVGCIGSRAMTGELTLDIARSIKDGEGNSFAGLLENLGYNLGEFDRVVVPKNLVHAFVELHIEQSVSLEQYGVPVGIVEAISGPTEIVVYVKGKQDHAGGTSMELRRDALAAAAEIMLKVESLAKSTSSPYTVGTVGKVNVFPNASNVIPGKVEFAIDVRDSDFEIKSRLLDELKESMQNTAKKRDVEIEYKMLSNDKPRHSSKEIVDIIENVCNQKQYPYHKTVSGAFHDAMHVADFAPFSMIFVPSKNGISHSPLEWTDYEDIEKGVDVLAETLFRLSNS